MRKSYLRQEKNKSRAYRKMDQLKNDLGFTSGDPFAIGEQASTQLPTTRFCFCCGSAACPYRAPQRSNDQLSVDLIRSPRVRVGEQSLHMVVNARGLESSIRGTGEFYPRGRLSANCEVSRTSTKNRNNYLHRRRGTSPLGGQISLKNKKFQANTDQYQTITRNIIT